MYPVENKNWWGRNWKWFVPTGCMTLILLVGGCVGSIFMVATTAMKSSDVYKDALVKASADPAVVEALGTPLTTGFFTSGSINTSGPSGDAAFSIPLSGPKGKGTIQLEAKKSGGEWTYSTLVVEVKNPPQRIDLLAKPEAEEPAQDEPVQDQPEQSESEPNP
ncbi:MAG TPA: cytochrome c oxidase assembly factor Coa1 family protein [Thermoanaerobaculia bacterium]|nr:cytochrome c oxidase assembly factor Coa1 family protein [Thermoanaerobaculia bacterium]